MALIRKRIREKATAGGGGATREWQEQQFAKSKSSLVLMKPTCRFDHGELRLFESAFRRKIGQLSVLEFE